MSRSAVFLPVATLPALCASCAAFHSPISGGAIRSFRSDSLPVSSVVQGFGFEPRLKRVPPACLKAAAATDSREEERTRVLLVTKIVQQCVPVPPCPAMIETIPDSSGNGTNTWFLLRITPRVLYMPYYPNQHKQPVRTIQLEF